MDTILNILIKNKGNTSKIITNNNFIINYSINFGRANFASYDIYPNQLANLKFGRKNFQRDIRLDSNNIYQLDPSANIFGGKMSRGHLCPSFIMSFDKSKKGSWASTYLMSNIIPQNRNFNCGSWQKLEMNTFQFIKKTNSQVKVIVGAETINYSNQNKFNSKNYKIQTNNPNTNLIWVDETKKFEYQIPNLLYQIIITNHEAKCYIGFNDETNKVFNIPYLTLINLLTN